MEIYKHIIKMLFMNHRTKLEIEAQTYHLTLERL